MNKLISFKYSYRRYFLGCLLILLMSTCRSTKPLIAKITLDNKEKDSVLNSSFDAPIFIQGDTWQYRNYQLNAVRANRIWEETVLEVNSDSVLFERKRVDFIMPSTSNWERIDHDMFPIFVGKEWKSEIIRNGKIVGKKLNKAISFVDIDTNAGQFQAIKYLSIFQIPEGNFHQIIWYSPAVKKLVLLAYVDEEGNISQVTELTEYKVY